MVQTIAAFLTITAHATLGGFRVTRNAWERIAVLLAFILLAGLAVMFFDIKDDDTAGTLSVIIFIVCIVPMAVWSVIYMYYAIRPRGWPE